MHTMIIVVVAFDFFLSAFTCDSTFAHTGIRASKNYIRI